MSLEQAKLNALSLAVALHSQLKVNASGDPGMIIECADAFSRFLAPDVVQPATTSPTKVSKPRKPDVQAKPARTEEEAADELAGKLQAEADAEDAKETAAAAGPKKEDVAEVITQCIAANKRAEIVALLKSYGASSASGIPPGKYAKFIDEAQNILLSA